MESEGRDPSFVIRHSSSRPEGARGFSLIELLIVIAIATLLASFTFAFVRQARRGQKRFQCITQLQQIYTAIRQYQLDELGIPPYLTSPAAPLTPCSGVPSAQEFASGTIPAPPRGLYALEDTRDVTSVNRLHCPESYSVDVQLLDLSVETWEGVRSFSSVETIPSYYYNSYQNFDSAVGLWQYQPFRGITDPTDPRYRLQLWPNECGVGQQRWMPLDSTIITWCPFHRKGTEGTLVLYFDGSVEIKNGFVDAWARGINPAFYPREEP